MSPNLSPLTGLSERKCVNDENETIASYQCRSMALRKDGELIIFHVRTGCAFIEPLSPLSSVAQAC
jgi:hypothetical protein